MERLKNGRSMQNEDLREKKNLRIMLGRHFFCSSRAVEYIWLYVSHGHHIVAYSGFELGSRP